MTRTISPLFLLRMSPPPTLQKKLHPCLVWLLRSQAQSVLLIQQPSYQLILLKQLNQAPATFTQTGRQRGSVCSRMRRKASHKVSHPSTSLECLQLSDQHITIQKSEALEKSVYAEQKPLLNSRGFFKLKKPTTSLRDI